MCIVLASVILIYPSFYLQYHYDVKEGLCDSCLWVEIRNSGWTSEVIVCADVMHMPFGLQYVW